MNGFRTVSIVDALFGAAVLMLAMVSNGCDDKGVEPKPVKDYPIYFADMDVTSKLFTYHPITQQFDSTAVMFNPVALTASNDGKRVYLAGRTSVLVLDTKSLSQIAELPYFTGRQPVVVSPDNQLVALPGADLKILRTSDFSIVYTDTDAINEGYFSGDSKTFVAASSRAPRGYVYSLNLADSNHTVARKVFSDGGPVQVALSKDESKWFLYLIVHQDLFAFEVYDVVADSIMFRDYLAPGYGEFAETKDGRYVFYTNPGNTGADWPTPPLNFKIFDVKENSISRVVFDSLLFTGGGHYVCAPNILRITPDNRWLVIEGGYMSSYVLYLWDIQAGRFVFSKDWNGLPRPMTNLSVQEDQ